MNSFRSHRTLWRLLLAIVGVVPVPTSLAQDTPQSAVVAKQHEKALANWKALFASETPPSQETAHFLLYGTAPGKQLKEIGAGLERQHALAVKALDMEKAEPWPGKLAVYFWPERANYISFVRTVEKRKAGEDETACFDVDGDEPHVIAGPPLLKLDLPLDGQAGENMAAALMSKKSKIAVIPAWVMNAFGRATVYRTTGGASLTAEHRRAYNLVVQKKKTLKDVIAGAGLSDEENLVLRASVLEYLAYSGRSTRFVPFIKGFEPNEAMAEPTVEAALESANIPLEKLDQAWQTWVKSFK